MIDFSNSRPVVRFRNTKTEASLGGDVDVESGVDYKYKEFITRIRHKRSWKFGKQRERKFRVDVANFQTSNLFHNNLGIL